MRYILFFQGIYYSLTGLWSIVNIESFSDFTQYQGDFFLKHTNGVLFLILGVLFFFFALKREMIKKISFFALLTALGVMAVEVSYIPKIGNPIPFWIDFALEGLIVITFLILFALNWKKF